MDAPTPVSVRHWFRQMRADDHLRDATQLDQIRTYARGQHAIVNVGAITLFDRDVPASVDVEAAARQIHGYWGAKARLRTQQLVDFQIER